MATTGALFRRGTAWPAPFSCCGVVDSFFARGLYRRAVRLCRAASLLALVGLLAFFAGVFVGVRRAFPYGQIKPLAHLTGIVKAAQPRKSAGSAESAAIARESRSKRALKSGLSERCEGSTLTATSLPSHVSLALNTSSIPV